LALSVASGIKQFDVTGHVRITASVHIPFDAESFKELTTFDVKLILGKELNVYEGLHKTWLNFELLR